jgi:hypothetical protein
MQDTAGHVVPVDSRQDRRNEAAKPAGIAELIE